jgi:hypothetical protein
MFLAMILFLLYQAVEKHSPRGEFFNAVEIGVLE